MSNTTIAHIANELHTHAQQGNFEYIKSTYFAQDALSEEPPHATLFATAQGVANIIAKGHKFNSQVETLHSITVHTPVIVGKYIFMQVIFDVTLIAIPRLQFNEMIQYTIENEQIVKEAFFY